MSISVYFIIMTTVVAFFKSNKAKNTKYIYFIWFLLFTLIVELTSFILNHKLNINPKPVYNIYIIFSFLFYFLFYKSIFRKAKNIKLMNVFILLHIIFIFINNFIFKQKILVDFISNSIVFSAILLIITLILFLLEIINNENLVFNIKKSLVFWISIGLLLFYVGSIPIIISAKYLQYEGLYHNVINTLNFIMYGCFTLGFIIADPKYNY